jgi:hypothetical protein
LPPGALVLGRVTREPLAAATVFDAFLDETLALRAYAPLEAGSWHHWTAASMHNLALRRAPFLAAGGFPEELRPRYFEDLVLAHRLLGPEPRVYYQPQAGVVHRHRLTLEQYLDREEALGTMIPVLAQVAPESYGQIFRSQAAPEVLAQRYSHWVAMDRSQHAAAYHCLQRWACLPQAHLGEGEARALRLSTLYQMHVPLKRLASRLGFLRGLQLRDAAHWQARTPQGLWRQVHGPAPEAPRPAPDGAATGR